MHFSSFPVVRKTFSGFLLASFLLLCGCKNTVYELELHPQENKLQRQLMTRVDSGKKGELGTLDKETIGRIAAEYQAEVPDNLKSELRFSAAFGPQMPQDIGGTGWYNYWPSSMGALYSYTEQFGGNEKLSGGLDRGLLAIDRLLLVLTVWVEAEFDGARDLEQVTAAINNEIRADLRNIFLLTWLEEASPKGVYDDEELLVRIIQYLSNQGYFSPTDMPQLYRAVVASDDNDEMLLALITRGLATRMGVPGDEPLPPSLDAFGNDWKSYAESFEKFVQSSEKIQALARDWAAEGGSNIELNEEGGIELQSLIDAFLDIDIFPTGSSSHLQVALHLPDKPLATNGDYDGETSVVTWSDRVTNGEDVNKLPASFFAFWTAPAIEFQEQRFGTVVIDGPELAEYALWSNGLTSKQRAEWEALLEGLDAESDAIGVVRNFKFSDLPESSTAGYAGVNDLHRLLASTPDEADETKVE